jgi:hypothetical protein
VQKTRVICMRPKNCNPKCNGSRAMLQRAPCDNVSVVTAMTPMLRAWHPTQRWRTMPPSYELLRRFSQELCPSGVPWTSRGAMDPG